MMEPQVSIVTPTYNRGKFIEASVMSVLEQTVPDWELLIVDDGSTDNTRQILEPYLDDPRIRYFYQSNQGQSVARNVAIQHARANCIGFLDSDDIWFPNKLKQQLAIFESNPDVHIVHGDEVTIDEQGHEVSRKNMQRYSGRITPQLMADNCVSITTALVRRECLLTMGSFDTRYGVADDYELWLRLSARYTFHYEPGEVAGYRVMADQISTDKRRRFAANERIIHDFLAAHPSSLSDSERRIGLARFYARKARYFASAGDRWTALRAVCKAIYRMPLNPIGWRALYRVLNPRRLE